MSATAAFFATGLVPAHADTADPVLPFHASVSINGSGDPVLTLSGSWAWTTHHSDCNSDRYAAGYAVDWNDANQAGNVVGTVGAQSVDVGAAAANALNPADNNVHYIHKSTDANPNGDPVGTTRCGTYDPIAGYNSGPWGPITHTYAANTTSFQVCVVIYDMHLQGMGPNVMPGDTVAGGMGHDMDNSVQGNKDTPLGNQCDTFSIPTLTTTSSPATASPGQGFTDKAVLTNVDSGHLPPTGNIVFTLHSATGNDANSCGATVAIAGNPWTVPVGTLSTGPNVYGAVTPSVSPSSPGTYYWQASYSGDAHNAAVDGKCTDSNESTTISQAAPTIATQVNHASVVVGDGITDTASLSGLDTGHTPTGSVIFSVYSGTTGSGNHCDTATLLHTFSAVAITAGASGSGTATATSPAYTTTGTGDVYWLASYSGDAHNQVVAGNCTDSGEHTTVDKATPGITTSATTSIPGVRLLVVGDPITDTATLTGLNPNELPPTGTISFSLFTDGNCQTAVAPAYSSSKSVTTLSPGAYGATSDPFTTAAAGNYHWIASYSGDGFNAHISGLCSDAGETSSIALTQPGISTSATATAVMPGPISDTATLSGLTATTPTGSITFTLYDGTNMLSPTGCGVADPSVSPITVNVGSLVGGGFGAATGAVVPPAAGTYFWLATYSGDGTYAATSGKCTDANETTIVSKAQPTIGTHATGRAQIGTTITDTATVSGGDSPTGTVTFTVYTNSTCTSQVNPAFTSTVSLNGAVPPTATSDPYTPTAAGTLYWGAVYNGDPNNLTVSHPCSADLEQTVVLPLNPTMATTATPLIAIPDPALGGPPGSIQDVATLTGATPNAGGTVTFELFGPVSTNTPTCSTLVTTVTGAVSTGQAVSPAVPVTQAGFYFWETSYSGDGNNSPIVLSGCGDANEASQVTMPSLGLDKSGLSNGPVPTSPIVLPGETISYTVSIPNSGTADVDDTTVTDTLPAYVDINPASISNGGVFTAGADITVSAGTIVWNDVDINAGTTTTLTYSVTVDASVPQGEVLTNLVQMGNLSATTTHQVPAGNLSVTKSVDKAVANYGDTLTYTLHVAATGNLDEGGVIVSDFIPGYDPANPGSGLTTYVPGSATCVGPGTCTVTYNAATHKLTWGIGGLVAGSSRNVTFQVTIDTPPAAPNGALPGETIINVASATSRENPIPVVSNPVTTVVNPVPGRTGDLSVTKSVDKTTANYGDTLTYTLHASASGNLTQHSVVLTDTIPAKTTYVAGSATCVGPGVCVVTYDAATHKLTWQIGDLAGGSTRDVTFQVTIDTPPPAPDGSIPGETIVNVGAASSAETPTPVPSNPVTTVVKPVLPLTGHLAIHKAVNKTTANYGDTLTYTLHVSAVGGLTEHNVVVTEVLPGYDPALPNSGLTTYVAGSASCNGTAKCVATYNPATHTITWHIGDLAAGTGRTLTFQVTINTPTAGAGGALPREHIDNQASVTSDDRPDPALSNVVHTVLDAVLGEHQGRHPASGGQVLPITGASIGDTVWLGALLLGVGIALETIRRRLNPRRPRLSGGRTTTQYSRRFRNRIRPA